MALTATATRTSRQTISRILGMTNVKVVSQSPNKPNITYQVQKKTNIEDTFTPLICELRGKRAAMDRVIIFGQTYEDCTEIFLLFRSSLGRELTEPVGAPFLPRYRLVDMFTVCTHKDVKDVILNLFQQPDSCLCIIVATVAFGMGLDCRNVRQVIHWGVPSDIESCIQETGSAGRNGQQAMALLYYTGADFSGFRVEQRMKEYCLLQASTYRRKFLMEEFDDEGCDCVDIDPAYCCDNCACVCTSDT